MVGWSVGWSVTSFFLPTRSDICCIYGPEYRPPLCRASSPFLSKPKLTEISPRASVSHFSKPLGLVYVFDRRVSARASTKESRCRLRFEWMTGAAAADLRVHLWRGFLSPKFCIIITFWASWEDCFRLNFVIFVGSCCCSFCCYCCCCYCCCCCCCCCCGCCV